MHVLRWGQSAYETDADMALEAGVARELGFTWSLAPDVKRTPDLSGVDVLVVTSKSIVNERVLAAFRGHTVLTTTSGYEHIDLDAARTAGVAVGRCPLARRDCVVEHALGAMIALGKRWPAQDRAAREGIWGRAELPLWAPLGLRGSRVLVVGLGVIGRTMATVLNALGVEVWGCDPLGVPSGVHAVHLDAALPEVDAVTLHCSLTPSSTGLLHADRLALLRPHAVVVNTARGDQLDVHAAVQAVREGRLRGLAADVFPEEPWPTLAADAVEGVLLTPHGAGYAPDLGRRVATEVGAALRALAEGRALPAVAS
jgi:phosphoglycerate dehydrogenase-like enzyme